MKRKARYTKDGLHRIISIPGGLWRGQEPPLDNGKKDYDPWQITHPAMELEDALAWLRGKEPPEVKQ